jgi:alpha-1,3-rhamnosyl/mannosyltransferase
MRVAIDARLVGRGLGIAQVITNIVRNLTADVEVVWLGDPALAPGDLAGVVRADRWPYPVLDGPMGRHWARRACVDLVHFAGNTGWRARGEVPFVLTVQDLLYLESGVRGRRLRQIVGHRYARRNVPVAVRSADAVACPSTASADEVAALTGRRPVVIPYGVDAPLLHAGKTPLPPQAASRGRYAVAFAARDPRKGVGLAIDGWRAAEDTSLRLLLLAGGGLPADVVSKVELAGGRIELQPYLQRPRLLEILAGAEALIYPSDSEGFGLPVIEAMALGVPVISGLNRAVVEVAGDAMLTIDPRDLAGSIGNWLRRLDREPALRERTIQSGLERARHYTWTRTAQAYEALYREVLTARQAAG